MKLLRQLSVGLAAIIVASSAMAQSFYINGITLQGKIIDLSGNTSTQGLLEGTNSFGFRKFAAFSLDGNVGASNTINSTTNPANIDFDGSVGVYATATSSRRLILTNSRVKGDVWIRSGGPSPAILATGSGGIVSGSGVLNNNASFDTTISNAVTALNTLSNNIQALTKTTNFTLSGFNAGVTPSNLSKIIASGTGDNTSSINISIAATDNNPVVLKLSDFVLNELGGTQLTLVGTAMSKFIIDVSGQFSLSNGSDIKLSGGLTAGNVIFNARGTGGAGLSGGSTMPGILLAKNGTVSLTGASELTGTAIGKSVALSGNSKIKTVSP
jgi:hypothetical protein